MTSGTRPGAWDRRGRIAQPLVAGMIGTGAVVDELDEPRAGEARLRHLVEVERDLGRRHDLTFSPVGVGVAEFEAIPTPLG